MRSLVFLPLLEELRGAALKVVVLGICSKRSSLQRLLGDLPEASFLFLIGVLSSSSCCCL
ncbi:ORF201 [White spot syndrome virus]|uniref:ORF201 n=1 Tax=White spot syndrome virus TaxID=342409 RepID=A0A2D3I752_9VIRU|nr:ORF201 [White spot syndrome virus]